jgi:pseudouridylate synthase
MDIRTSDEVKEALAAGLPVVALESTVISHGLPFPLNIETAHRLEAAVRDSGAVPATIAVLDGAACVGLSPDEIERLARPGIRKISRRDLPVAVARRLDCATTVATTSFIAERAGIRLFATGGIGGVHRGVDHDVSADLVELARTPIAVVCSGPKIVLDLAATREWLETFGITLLGWQCDEMPAFYCRSSGLPVDERVETAEEAAAVIEARDRIGIPGAVVVAAPVPAEAELDRGELESLLERAVADAVGDGIAGKHLTPFLLAELAEKTAGRTIAANIALLENNARIAAGIAIALAGRA